MTDVFISYAHEDHAYVRRMAPALEAEGFTVWWDHTIPPGKTWDEVIAKGIADARCCVVLWSQSSVVSDWVKEEATIAKDHRKFIPVQIDNSEPPVGFRRIQAAHLQNWTGNVNEPQWQMLVREIRGVVSASRESGAPAARSSQSYAPRNYAPPPARNGPSPLAVGAMAIAGAVALAAIIVAMLPRGETAAPPAPEIAAEAPVAAPGPDPEMEKLRGERDEALRRAQAERQAREEEAARLQRERNEATAAAERAREQLAARERAEAAEQRAQAALLGSYRGQIAWRGANTLTITWFLNADGTIVTSANEHGRWSRTGGGGFQGEYRGGGGDRITFRGQLQGNRISGTINSDYQGGFTGSFDMTRQ